MRRLLVVCGESMRGDDAAAFVALDALEGSLTEDVVVRRTRAPSPEDFLNLDADGVCVVADAVRGVRAGRVVTVSLAAVVDGVEEGSMSTHTLPLRDSLRIARSVLGFMPAGSFVGIGGEEFGLGSDMSSGVTENLTAFATAIVAAIEVALAARGREVP
ncbi:MAG: hydrogenase maturation protease [Acidimicrobiia bacterium]|nr:hydrogenase maturation protease [Acidimicrobiia bacterium]